MTPIEFLAARYAEDWSAARDRELAAGLDESRETRDIDAKRAILAMLADDEAALDRGYTELTRGSQLALLGVVRHLTAVYSDHPDYGLIRSR